MKPSASRADAPKQKGGEIASPLVTSLKACLQTREGRAALSQLIPEVFHLWAGDSPIRQKVSRPVARHVETALRPAASDGRTAHPDLADLFPDIVDSLFTVLTNTLEALDTLAPEEKQKRLAESATAKIEGIKK